MTFAVVSISPYLLFQHRSSKCGVLRVQITSLFSVPSDVKIDWECSAWQLLNRTASSLAAFYFAERFSERGHTNVQTEANKRLTENLLFIEIKGEIPNVCGATRLGYYNCITAQPSVEENQHSAKALTLCGRMTIEKNCDWIEGTEIVSNFKSDEKL